MSSPTTTFALAGSTQRSVAMAQALVNSGQFQPQWVVCPTAKPVGRQQTLNVSPTQIWAESHQLPVIHIENKIDESIRKAINNQEKVDFLLVVDFGYLVPDWLLQLPTTAPINIHPSELPRWRGSSPAQFSLLYGDTRSATTIMIMNSQLDQGPILTQQPFEIGPSWTQTEYYQRGFELAAQLLPQTLLDLATGKLSPTPQPGTSPTPTARQLTKQDSFVSWSLLQRLMSGAPVAETDLADTSTLLISAAQQQTWLKTIDQATRAFQPWPSLWSLVPTPKGPKRLKILSLMVGAQTIELKRVQFEGQQPADWSQVKNGVSS